MPDPSVPIVLKKLLSLDTPVSRRIFEIALMLALIIGASYAGEHYKDKEGLITFACEIVGVFGGMVLLLLIAVLVMTIIHDAQSTLKK